MICSEGTAPVVTQPPYDCWIAPEGEVIAQFFRIGPNFLVRFPARVDFQIDSETFAVCAWPTSSMDEDEIRSIFDNSIAPIVGNHRGGIFLHGSAVCIEGKAIAFLGTSRSGKTTLAGGFANRGCALLSEDVVEISLRDHKYQAEPKPSALRLFPDSAEYLFGEKLAQKGNDHKAALRSAAGIKFADRAVPLSAFFLLGADHSSPFEIRSLSAQSSLAGMLPHAFILDVQDKLRLRGHFDRLADLTQVAPCYALNYPRDYQKLPSVLDEITRTCEALHHDNDYQ